MSNALEVTVSGHRLVLSAGRAAYDPVVSALLVADAHFGKGAVFRARGIPVPSGTTLENLTHLNRLVEQFRPRHLVFLGDLFHAREAHADATIRQIAAWRARHSAMPITLVGGNHDRHAGPLPTLLEMTTVAEPYRLGPWALCHFPQQVAGAYVLAGHEHPVFRLRAGHDSLRLPCFRFAERHGVLPAFGSFTGGSLVPSDAATFESIYLIANDHVVPIAKRK